MPELTVPEDFSGVIAVHRKTEPLFEGAYGFAERARGVPNRLTTRFGMASGAKGFTALAVMSLVESGELRLDTPARSLLGTDLPLVGDDVTIEHLLAHRSGIGDYLNEDGGEITDYVLSVPVHRLDVTEAFLPMLDGLPAVFPAGVRFAYNDSGYMVLALLAERAASVPFHDLVTARVLEPAGLTETAYLRSDELPPDTATGYLHADGLRTNVLHLPVRGNGDGGAYSTVADVRRFWEALFAGRIVSPGTLAEMLRPRSVDDRMRYGMGFWLRPGGEAQLEGYDAGVSFLSVYDPATATSSTVIANWSEGAWPVTRQLVDMTW